MAKIAASPVPAKPASPEEQFATTVTAVRKMTIDSALDKAKLVDPGIREALARSTDMPVDPAAIEAFVTAYAIKYPPVAPVAAIAAIAPVVPVAAAHQGRSDTGAPGGAGGAVLPDNPLQWTRDQAYALLYKNPREMIRRVENWAWKGSMTNVYAMRRNAR